MKVQASSAVQNVLKKNCFCQFFFLRNRRFSGFLINFVGCCGQQQSLKRVCPPTDFSSTLIIIARDDANVRRFPVSEGYSLNQFTFFTVFLIMSRYWYFSKFAKDFESEKSFLFFRLINQSFFEFQYFYLFQRLLIRK